MADDREQIGLAAVVTAAWLSNPHTRAQADDASAMLGSVHAALLGMTTTEPAAVPLSESELTFTPAVTKRKSLASPDHIISMIDGKPYRSLTRHLRTHGLTPDEYRQRYGLQSDYPMVAPSYSAERSAAAKQHNFGRPAAATPKPAIAKPSTPKPGRARKGIVEAKRAARAHLGTDSNGTTSATSE